MKIPAGIDDRVAAAIMLKGMTAWYLIRRTYKVKKGDTILMHAAAGGVGQILCQWAKSLGATVIGTVGSDEKAALAKKAGCKHVIVTSKGKILSRASRRSPRARACRWCMTASARIRSWTRSIAWRRSA